MENEPQKYAKFYLEAGEQKLECIPENTFAFLYEETKYDHIFYVVEETEDGYNGLYIWREMLGERFETLVKYMIDANFVVENEDEIQECDKQAYLKSYPDEITLKTYELTPRKAKLVDFLAYLLEKERLTADEFSGTGDLYI